MYLAISDVGFFIGLSREAAEAKCRKLKVQKSEVIRCTSLEDAARCVKAFGANSEPLEIVINSLTYWKPIKKALVLDLCTGERHLCYSDGTVIWETKDGKKIIYKICQDGLEKSPKTVKLLQKYGALQSFDFENGMIIKVTKEGEIWKKAENAREWEKVSE